MLQNMSGANGDTPKKNKKLSVREFFQMSEVAAYFFRRKDPDRPRNINIKMMHGINRIAIIMFLLGIIFIVIKRFFS